MEADEVQRLLKEPIQVLDLNERINNQLEGAGIATIGELLNCCSGLVDCDNCSWKERCGGGRVKLMSIPMLGVGSLDAIYDALEDIGLLKAAT